MALGLMMMGFVSRSSLANHSGSEWLLHVAQPRLCQGEGFWKVGGQVTFWPLLNYSGWWWLVSSMFLTRTSYHKIIHTDGYYGACPEWAVSVSVFPLTVQPTNFYLTFQLHGSSLEILFLCCISYLLSCNKLFQNFSHLKHHIFIISCFP